MHATVRCLGRVLVGLLVVSAAYAAAPELSKNVRVYRAEDGVRVAVAQVLPTSEGKAAVRVTGSDAALDDLVLLAQVEDLGDRGSNLKITWRGRNYNLITSRESWWGGSALELHVPEQKSRSVYYHDGESKQTPSAELAQGLQRDRAKAEALARFERDKEQAKHELALQKSVSAVKAACGAPIAMSIEWPSIDDETLRTRSISSFCAAPLDSLAKLCVEPKRAALIKDKIKQASCRFGPELRLRIEGGTLSWQTAVKAPNQGEFVRSNLLNVLQ